MREPSPSRESMPLRDLAPPWQKESSPSKLRPLFAFWSQAVVFNSRGSAHKGSYRWGLPMAPRDFRMSTFIAPVSGHGRGLTDHLLR